MKMKLHILLILFLLSVSPVSFFAQQVAPSSSASLVAASASPQDTTPVKGDDYTRYKRKAPADSLWKFSAAISLLMMVIILMLIMKKRKK
jgi:hypothetical protein